MVIPESPLWSDLTDIKKYPNYGIVAPNTVIKEIHSISLGPIALNDSKGTLIDKYWLVQQIDGQVVISKALT